ncbi:MAG: hypothetical protein H3C30_10090 [Candidatus Hydrogenedentes bacterium]|nr:hypothetical protein [Candidatus Hydrogenedentota bacterium]
MGDTVIAVAASDEGPSNQSIATSGAGGQAQLWNYSGNNYLSAAASTKPGAAGTVTSSFTTGQGSDYAAGAISIKPAVAPAPVVTISGGNTLTGECGVSLVLPGATALDGCGAGIAAAVSDLDGLNEANPAIGVYNVVYSATDGAGTTGTETLVVTVGDTTGPVVVITGGNTLDAECGVPVLLPDAEATDACDGPLAASVSDLDGLDVNNPSKGVYSVVYGATDLEGNTGTETLTVTVNDTADPLVVITGGNSLASQCGLAITLPGASAFDGCDGALGISIAVPLGLNLSDPALGAYNVTYTATDGEGYTGSAILAVTVSDTAAPEITQCANDQTVSANALCEALVPDFTGGVIAVDNCDPSPVITQDPVAGTAVGLGDTIIIITATDAEGNSDACQATLTVEDVTAPEITVCATGQSEFADENCEALVPDFTGAVVAADNCDANPVITQDPVAGTVVGLGVTAVTITVTDAAGNAETCVANFTVNEDVPPTGTILINNNLSVTNSPDVTLNLTWDDGECASGVVRMRFSDDGKTWSAWEPLAATTPYTLPGPDGYNTVRVQYRDRANNVSDRFNDYIRMDTIAPTGTIWINNNAWRTFDRNVTLNLTWDDTDGSGVVRMRFSQDGKTWTAWEPLSATKAIFLTGPIGYNTVRVQYRDAAGNNSDRFNDYILLAE